MNHAEADLIARRMVARYAAAIDRKSYDSIAALFAEEGELRRSAATLNGRAAIDAFYRDILPTVGHMRHFMSNTIAEPDGDVIRVHSLFSYLQVVDEGVRFGWGDYNDVIRPTSDDNGLFLEKEIIVHHSEVAPLDVSSALLPGAWPPV